MDTDELIQCPYNKSHSILSSRMQFHLMKCRLQYPGLEKATCPFNSTHIVNKIELEYHCGACPDRIVIDSYIYVMGPDPEVAKPLVSKIEPLAITGEELWDDETPENVLETVQESCKTRLALQTVVGVSKSERKAFRHQQRLKAAYLTNTPGSTTNGSQRTTGNASGAQQTPRRTLNNPWGTSNPTAMNNENRAQRNEDVSESVVSISSQQEAGAVRKMVRDPSNPWSSSFITSTSSVLADNSGFPGLPVTARRQNGRGPNNRN